MDARLKQRVVGAIVLTTLAIIILPMLLDGTADDRARVIANIPDPPVIDLESMSVDDIERNMRIMEQASSQQLPAMVPDTTPYEEAPAEEFGLDKNALPVSWSLQLASFQNPQNALKLREELREAAYRSYILQAHTDNGETYRVYVGPMVQRAKLEEIAMTLKSSMNLDGQIVRYKLEDDKGQLGG
ncbi:MAG: SPOR domain-containing protein [Pseudomonadales bacterium]|nr:SPOR domain-containing protein [Pseudomonadales bacterium]